MRNEMWIRKTSWAFVKEHGHSSGTTVLTHIHRTWFKIHDGDDDGDAKGCSADRTHPSTTLSCSFSSPPDEIIISLGLALPCQSSVPVIGGVGSCTGGGSMMQKLVEKG